MERTRILLVRAGLLADIVRDILSGRPEIELVGEVGESEDVLAAVERTKPNIVIWALDASRRSMAAEPLLERHPRVRLLSVENDGRTGVVCRLLPGKHQLEGELSPEVLLRTVREYAPAVWSFA